MIGGLLVEHFDVSEEINTSYLEKKIEEKIKKNENGEKKVMTIVKPAVKKKVSGGYVKKGQ